MDLLKDAQIDKTETVADLVFLREFISLYLIAPARECCKLKMLQTFEHIESIR
jgi:hypothetical protein